MHYNAVGEIDRWGSKYEILFLPAISILLYVFITAVSFFPQIWNVPVQITDENKEVVYLSTKDLLIFVKVEMLTLFFYINYHTATAQPLIVSESFCTVAADAVDETRIKNKIRAADAKATECNFLLVFIYPTPASFIYFSYKKC